MYYDDQGRRYNLLSGFVFGALLGAGLGLLLPRRKPLAEAVRRGAARARV